MNTIRGSPVFVQILCGFQFLNEKLNFRLLRLHRILCLSQLSLQILIPFKKSLSQFRSELQVIFVPLKVLSCEIFK